MRNMIAANKHFVTFQVKSVLRIHVFKHVICDRAHINRLFNPGLRDDQKKKKSLVWSP